MSDALKILHLEDDADISRLVGAKLTREGVEHDLQRVETREEFLQSLKGGGVDIILLDYALPAIDGVTALELAHQLVPGVPCVFFTGSVGEERATQLIKSGATDFVVKPHLAELFSVIARLRDQLSTDQQRRLTEEQSAVRERYFSAIIANSNDLISVIDATGKILFQNPASQTSLGYSPSELVGRDVFELVHPEDAGRFRELFGEAMGHSHFACAADYRFRRKDGTWCHLEGRGNIFQESDGRRLCVCNSRDVSARKEVEEQLQLLSRAIHQAEATVVITGSDGVIEFVNPAFERLTGYSAAEAVGRTPAILKSGRHDARFYQELWRRITAGHAFEWTFINRKKSGELYDHHAIIQSLRGPDGHATHFIATGRDVTEHRRQTEMLRERAELLDQATDAISVRDLDNRLRYWNTSAVELFGIGRAEAVGRLAHELPALGEAAAYAEIRAALTIDGTWLGELKGTNAAGEEIILESRWTLVKSDDGQPKSYFVINTDVSRQHQLQAQFLQAQRMESIGTLAGGVAHDLNNIFSPIMMAAPVLRDAIADPGLKEVLDTIETCTERGSGIVRQLLTFARGVEGEKLVIQTRHLIKEMAHMVRETFPKNIEFTTLVPSDLWPVPGDPTQLHQVLLNLCVNARDAMPYGGRLNITARNFEVDANYAHMEPGIKPGPHIQLEVRDTGTGIPREILGKIFDPFFTTKPLGKGTGLGLATVHGIVQKHGGVIKVESSRAGTCFAILLPAVPDQSEAVSIETRAPAGQGQGETVLVVDDEEGVHKVLKSLLEQAGYRTLFARDGTEALARYVSHREIIKAVLTDVSMPHMDGATLARTLRKICPAVKIIFMTGLGSAGDRLRAGDLRDYPYLAKPFNARKLLATLHEQLGRLVAGPG